MIRAFLKYLVEGESGSARMFLPVAAGLFTAVLFAAIAFGPKIHSKRLDTVRVPISALTAAGEPPYAAPMADIVGGDSPQAWLKAQLESRMATLARGGKVEPKLGGDGDWENQGLRQWVTDYLCPVRDWDGRQGEIRALVWNGVGECQWHQRWAAGIPILALLGFGWGSVILVLLVVLTIGAWGLALTFHKTRNAYRWLYRSKVF